MHKIQNDSKLYRFFQFIGPFIIPKYTFELIEEIFQLIAVKNDRNIQELSNYLRIERILVKTAIKYPLLLSMANFQTGTRESKQDCFACDRYIHLLGSLGYLSTYPQQLQNLQLIIEKLQKKNEGLQLQMNFLYQNALQEMKKTKKKSNKKELNLDEQSHYSMSKMMNHSSSSKLKLVYPNEEERQRQNTSPENSPLFSNTTVRKLTGLEEPVKSTFPISRSSSCTMMMIDSSLDELLQGFPNPLLSQSNLHFSKSSPNLSLDNLPQQQQDSLPVPWFMKFL